jgi:hypothetical protein
LHIVVDQCDLVVAHQHLHDIRLDPSPRTTHGGQLVFPRVYIENRNMVIGIFLVGGAGGSAGELGVSCEGRCDGEVGGGRGNR